jgi:hypothetical protein
MFANPFGRATQYREHSRIRDCHPQQARIMKIKNTKRKSVQGTVLCVTLLTAGVLGLLMGSYLTLVETECRTVGRSQCWNDAIVVAESGIEEGMAHLNSGVTTNNLATNSWVSRGGGNYAKTNTVGNGYSVVTIQTAPAVTNAYPVILSTAHVPGPLSGPELTRTVRVETKPKANVAVPGAMVVLTTLNWTGSGCTSDSFNSSDTNYSTGGMYDPTKAEAHGDITTLSTNAGAINLANGTVKGTVHTAPGGQQDVTATLGSGASVGDMAWVNSKKAGWEAGHFMADETTPVPDASLPSLNWFPAKSGNYKISGLKGNFNYSLDNSSSWQITDLSGSIYVSAPNVVLYVDNSFNIPSGSQIYIAPGASLTVYCGAATANIGGQGVVNMTGIAGNFNFYGLPSNTYINFGANANFVGYIYAPEAYFALGGGGSTPYDFVGRSVTQSVKMNGHYNFHYDEAPQPAPTFSGYAAMSWNEL